MQFPTPLGRSRHGGSQRSLSCEIPASEISWVYTGWREQRIGLQALPGASYDYVQLTGSGVGNADVGATI